MNSEDLKNKLITKVVDRNGEVIYDFTDTIDAINNKINTLEKENQELKEDNLQMQGYYEYYSKENIELKEELKRCQEYIKKSTNDHKNLIIENGKMKKALEILKNKMVNIHKSLTNTLIIYNELALLLGYDKLTQEEYELLKEVLGDEN